MTPAQLAVAKSIRAAEAGVEYRPGRGAYCPARGAKLRAYITKSPDAGYRVRYHKCADPACVLSRLGKNVKSIEEMSQKSVSKN